MSRYPPLIVFNFNYSCGARFICWDTDTSGFFSIIEERRRFQLFSVLAFKTSAFASLLEEGFSTTVRKPSRLSDPCFAVFNANVGFKLVFKLVAINLYSYSISTFTSGLVQNFFHLTTFLNILIAIGMSA